ncbi:sarcosine oxidase subunit alpha family protein [Octadecabacter sp. CECT 8868]|uniref:sarcosine oxidase subunit alpha family protein n=1 Tax=Octadecabacter algicola TaxID=2909342 RepID=UPI001F3DEF68|nr:sarcosine oxidase subunit alpha family protein [Octadecabacter algicola]MCF2905452.1 sarcosine oxidase subunit alpha family protein [Octadecabacter algicola]
MRVQGKGLNANGAPLTFTFDGQEYQGREGDTLAAALLANGQRLVGRSFKYHRPRGILSAGSEEPNALVTLGEAAKQDPNIRATTQELFDGLEARSQNAWPSLKNDVMAVNDLMSPFLSAGFYYKTFMWPKAFWEKVYEPIIRRAAGLGALSGETNDDTYEKAFAHCDVLVIGAGPAGIMAALTAARAGLDVILADEDSRMGGRLLAETYDVDGQAGADWATQQIAELNAMENVRLMPRTTVAGAYDQGTYAALERVGHHRADRTGPRECFWRIVSKRSILCAGALERPIAFPNNDRPGIMTAGAVRSYLNRWGVAPGQAVTVFANNDDAHRTALDFIDAGVTVAGVIDSRDSAHALGDYPLFKGGQVIATKGRHGLTSITVEHSGGTEEIATDCLAMSGGWNPTVHLTCHMNGRPTWSDNIFSFVPTEGSVPNMSVAGAANGVFSTLGCLQDGIDTTQRVLVDLGVDAADVETPSAEDAPYRIEPLWQVEGKGRKWLDFQNDVTVKDIRLAALENFRSVEHMKRYTTQGMATDQGKNSNVAALAVLADATGRGIPETGTTTFRPPYSPVAIAAMGAGSQGHGFAPERLMTSHHATTSRGAPMIEAGLWYRPSYFPRSGEETWLDSCNREVTMVRGAVGVCDVSTLGKIDIQGPDAAAFLDFVYCNTFSTLKEKRVRYGLMLREDGHVMDDGTTACLGPNHYVMTTTTAAAGQVMRHLDWVSQALRPDLDVRFASVTEQWAQFAVAGPKSRDLLNTIFDDEIDNDSWPFMACGTVGISGVQGRLFRISFSGEHAYEIAVPARYGASLFGQLTAQAEAMGGGAYGMEALNVMRIEKGFITHAEIHGRTTAFDIGFDRMVSQKKDCIGNAPSRREGLLDPQREQLVGLKPIEADGKLTSGAHLFVEGADAVRLNSQGYVTSVCYSPTLGHDLGLAFLKDGPNRYGEHVILVDHLRDVRTLYEVCHPVFLDPEGELARG